jgi:hypothetical protein
MNANDNHSTRQTTEADWGVQAPRHHAARLAQQFSLAAFQQAEKAVTGILAVPATLALGTAAGALFVAAIVEGGFDLVGASITEVGRRIGEGGHAARELGDRRGNHVADQHVPS